MPRKKISIQEAFAVLEESGIQIQVKSVKDTPVQPVKVVHPDIFKNTPVEDSPVIQTNNKTVKLKLFAKHSIGSGGHLNADAKQVEEVESHIYGPGVCTVPIQYVEQLLYADRQAKLADERMLDKEVRSYIIAQRVTSDGLRANVGIPVSDSMFNLGNLPDHLMHFVR